MEQALRSTLPGARRSGSQEVSEGCGKTVADERVRLRGFGDQRSEQGRVRCAEEVANLHGIQIRCRLHESSPLLRGGALPCASPDEPAERVAAKACGCKSAWRHRGWSVPAGGRETIWAHVRNGVRAIVERIPNPHNVPPQGGFRATGVRNWTRTKPGVAWRRSTRRWRIAIRRRATGALTSRTRRQAHRQYRCMKSRRRSGKPCPRWPCVGTELIDRHTPTRRLTGIQTGPSSRKSRAPFAKDGNGAGRSLPVSLKSHAILARPIGLRLERCFSGHVSARTESRLCPRAPAPDFRIAGFQNSETV